MPSQPNPVTSIATRPQPAGLRVGDRERSDACDQLSAHFAAGRLSDNELEERLSAAVAGRTKSDLHRLLADLPPLTDSSRKTAAPATVPRPAGLASNVLDVFALIAVIGCVIMAGLGALLVLFSGDGGIIAFATLTTMVAGVGSASVVHLVHRAWAHDHSVRPPVDRSPP